jgi:hypothetical protein
VAADELTARQRDVLRRLVSLARTRAERDLTTEVLQLGTRGPVMLTLRALSARALVESCGDTAPGGIYRYWWRPTDAGRAAVAEFEAAAQQRGEGPVTERDEPDSTVSVYVGTLRVARGLSYGEASELAEEIREEIRKAVRAALAALAADRAAPVRERGAT